MTCRRKSWKNWFLRKLQDSSQDTDLKSCIGKVTAIWDTWAGGKFGTLVLLVKCRTCLSQCPVTPCPRTWPQSCPVLEESFCLPTALKCPHGIQAIVWGVYLVCRLHLGNKNCISIVLFRIKAIVTFWNANFILKKNILRGNVLNILQMYYFVIWLQML